MTAGPVPAWIGEDGAIGRAARPPVMEKMAGRIAGADLGREALYESGEADA